MNDNFLFVWLTSLMQPFNIYRHGPCTDPILIFLCVLLKKYRYKKNEPYKYKRKSVILTGLEISIVSDKKYQHFKFYISPIKTYSWVNIILPCMSSFPNTFPQAIVIFGSRNCHLPHAIVIFLKQLSSPSHWLSWSIQVSSPS